MEREPCLDFQLPPGFRFHPSDEELIVHYLKNKVASRPLPVSIIAAIDLYKYNPWELPKKAFFGEDEWYFFSPRDRKYPNGARPNRAAGSGYWKATGTDRPILTSSGSKNIGVQKALVFYSGRPPKGIKTNWIMNEYRLLDATMKPSSQKGHEGNSLKRKTSEESSHDNLHPSNKKLNNGNRDEDFLPGDTLGSSYLNYYHQNQSQESFYTPTHLIQSVAFLSLMSWPSTANIYNNQQKTIRKNQTVQQQVYMAAKVDTEQVLREMDNGSTKAAFCLSSIVCS
ncbi:hypothetical protein GH714_014117 [Hevea brasiliensis]|uniref:NAC domain-containing protein n=1 Tax=Hevea brasiliensis TaxID=3981 RepID=A0A6A6LJX2_HEVBR|nr:hypothetical protein GH714_014117 [Hevea brasiliensis]